MANSLTSTGLTLGSSSSNNTITKVVKKWGSGEIFSGYRVGSTGSNTVTSSYRDYYTLPEISIGELHLTYFVEINNSSYRIFLPSTGSYLVLDSVSVSDEGLIACPFGFYTDFVGAKTLPVLKSGGTKIRDGYVGSITVAYLRIS